MTIVATSREEDGRERRMAAETESSSDKDDELRQLGERIADLAARINAAEGRMMALLADFDRRGGWKDDFSSCAEWLAWRTGVKIGPAERALALHAKNWKDDASEKQWRQCFQDYVFPKLGHKRVGEITTADVLACLVPIWDEKRPTAARVRRRIGAVMKWAVARGYREDNPADDAIAAALPRGRRHRTHFRALPHGEVGAALEAVRESDAWLGIRLCLEFVALTATRSGEARRARWPEIDCDRATWTVPAERMKGGREHRVPLSSGALAVLERAREIENGSGLIFPSFKGFELRSPQVAGAFRDLGIPSTVHGLRSSFRDWAAETGVDRTVAEAALAHKVGGVEGAYFRSDLFERRRRVMEDWSAYLAGGRAGTET